MASSGLLAGSWPDVEPQPREHRVRATDMRRRLEPSHANVCSPAMDQQGPNDPSPQDQAPVSWDRLTRPARIVAGLAILQ